MSLAQNDLRSIAVFRAVVEHQGFVGAQIALGLSQSAVSFHMKSLEERLGFTLCRRGRSGFELTDRGAIVLERSKDLFLSITSFESEVALLRNKIVGTLHLGLVDNTLSDPALPMPHIIDRLIRRAPEVQINLQIDAPDKLKNALAQGEMDAAILPETDPIDGIRFSPLYNELHHLFCGRQHPLFKRVQRLSEGADPAASQDPEPPLTRQEIERYPFVIRPYARMRELQHFPGAESGAYATNIEAQAMFILSGHYLGYLPAHYAEEHVRAGRACAILPDQVAILSAFVLATRVKGHASGVLDLFVSELVLALSEHLHRTVPVDMENPPHQS